MPINALGYMGIRSDSLDDWATYGADFLGLQLVERTKHMLRFRMDDRKQRIVVADKELERTAFGWEVDSEIDMDAVAARVEAAGTRVDRVPSGEAAMMGVTAAVRFSDPVGNRLEVFHGAETADTPFVPGRPISGFRTGALGMGHVVIFVPKIEDLLWFYQDVLGFRLSDYVAQPFKAYFFHVNPRHHSFALFEAGRSGIHHLMMELGYLDDVGQGYDLALDVPGRIATTLGRHSNDFMTSFYARTPEHFFVEYGWGGRSIDVNAWKPYEMTYGASMWGHLRDWLPPEQLAEARKLRDRAATDGVRVPVQVSDKNFETGSRSCAWWDEMKRRSNG